MINVRTAIMALTAAGALAAMPSPSMAQKKQRDVITREELLSTPRGDQNLYELIRFLRPHMLQARPGVRSMGGSNASGVSVYLDRKRDIGTDVLRTLRPDQVEEVRYMDPSKAESEFGFAAAGGAILVKLYKAPKDTLGS